MDKQLAAHHSNGPSPAAKVLSAAFYGVSSLAIMFVNKVWIWVEIGREVRSIHPIPTPPHPTHTARAELARSKLLRISILVSGPFSWALLYLCFGATLSSRFKQRLA